MSRKRYTEEFKVEAVRQVTERGHSVPEVAKRLGVTTKSLYEWKRRYAQSPEQAAAKRAEKEEVQRLRRELKRVTEERDILKRPPRTLPSSPGKVRVHSGAPARAPGDDDVRCPARAPEWLLRVVSAADEPA